MKFTVANNALLPADLDAREFLKQRKIGEAVELREAEMRSKQRNLVYAVLTRLAKIPEMAQQANLRALLAIETGHVDFARWNSSLPPRIVPRSLSDMRAAEFEAFWDTASDLILRALPAGAEADEIKNMIEAKDGKA